MHTDTWGKESRSLGVHTVLSRKPQPLEFPPSQLQPLLKGAHPSPLSHSHPREMLVSLLGPHSQDIQNPIPTPMVLPSSPFLPSAHILSIFIALPHLSLPQLSPLPTSLGSRPLLPPPAAFIHLLRTQSLSMHSLTTVCWPGRPASLNTEASSLGTQPRRQKQASSRSQLLAKYQFLIYPQAAC